LVYCIADIGEGDKRYLKKNFPGETFRFSKEKEEKQYGEYHFRHRVLESLKPT
jgi:hypothetical protein